MKRKLVYDGEVYENFSINEYGEIKNLSTNHIYKHSIHKSGYAVVYLPMGRRGKVKMVRVHKAVAETFIPNPNNLPIVHHKDENKLNPYYKNLEWVTSKMNTKYHHDKLKEDTEYYNNRKLNIEDIKNIKLYDDKNISRREIAKMFNVSRTTIDRLLKGETYKEYN